MVKDITYISKNTDIYGFISRLVNSAITNDFVDATVTSMSKGIKEIFEDPSIWENASRPSEGMRSQIQKEIDKQNIAKVTNYKKWILGYGLILHCAIFEEFLVSLLDAILTKNPHLASWNTKKEILARFRESTIKEKYNTFVIRLNFTEKEFFDFTAFNDEILERYKDVGILKLNEIYKKRNDAAHTDSYVVYKLSYLNYIHGLFEKLILNLTIKSRKKWQISSEMVELVKKSKENNENK